jgi:hypothetical protein
MQKGENIGKNIK